jgi:short subunit dehydrogenase-like uncharacterized protein
MVVPRDPCPEGRIDMADATYSSSLTWMIYGANGYSGELLARAAVSRGHKPVLAGRNAVALGKLGAELGLPQRVFGLDDPAALARGLSGIGLVAHCAGPFSQTSAQMIEACLSARVHYLDICGELAVLSHAHAQHVRALEAGVALCPAVGFDVIPTDCMAARLLAALPDATHLALGFDTRSALSPGTAKTTVESIALGGKVRENGEIRTVPLGHDVRRIDFGDGEKVAMAIPWGDVLTAYVSTGIPNISVYTPVPRALITLARRAHYLAPVVNLPWVQRAAQGALHKLVQGPDEAARKSSPTFVWGEARNAAGLTKTARMVVDNGYTTTALGTLAVVEYVSVHPPVGGAYTPSKLCGVDLVSRIPGAGPLQLT